MLFCCFEAFMKIRTFLTIVFLTSDTRPNCHLVYVPRFTRDTWPPFDIRKNFLHQTDHLMVVGELVHPVAPGLERIWWHYHHSTYWTIKIRPPNWKRTLNSQYMTLQTSSTERMKTGKAFGCLVVILAYWTYKFFFNLFSWRFSICSISFLRC